MLTSSIPHYYGRISQIESKSIVTVDEVHWISLPPSARDSIDKMKVGDAVLIDLAAWSRNGIADVYVFRRDPTGVHSVGVLREVTSFHFGKGCGISGTLATIAALGIQ